MQPKGADPAMCPLTEDKTNMPGVSRQQATSFGHKKEQTLYHTTPCQVDGASLRGHTPHGAPFTQTHGPKADGGQDWEKGGPEVSANGDGIFS